MSRMHVFDETDGPAVDLRLPLDVARRVRDHCRHAMPAVTGLDGTVVDEINAQLCDQVDQGTGELLASFDIEPGAPLTEVPAGREHTAHVLADVLAERVRQHEKWGDQRHADGTGPDVQWLELLRTSALQAPANRLAITFRVLCQAAMPGEDTWRAILLEEVAEAFAENDPIALRRELVQVAAVAVQWVEVLDREQADRDEQDAMHSAAMAEAEAAGERL